MTMIIIIILAVLIIVGFSIYNYYLQSENGKHENGTVEEEKEDIKKDPKEETGAINEQGEHYIIDVKYPITENEEINAVVDNLMQERADKVKLEAEEFFSGPNLPEALFSWKYSLYADYSVFHYSSNIVSFKFDMSEFKGGAHPSNSIVTKTFDREEGKEISLSDIFRKDSDYLNALSEISFQQLIQKFLADENLKDGFDESWVENGTSPSENNFKNFVLAEDSIIFYFEQYQVIAYAAGEQNVEIKYSQLTDILNPSIINP